MVGRCNSEAVKWWILKHGVLVPAPWVGPDNYPWLSPDGKVAVTISWPDHHYARLTAYDPSTGATLGFTDVKAAWIACCGGGQDVEIQSIDAEHQVFFLWDKAKSGYYMWQVPPSPSATSRPVRVQSLLSQSRGIGDIGFGPHGPITAKGQQSVDASGHLGPAVGLPAIALGATDAWSPNLRVLAYGDMRDTTPGVYDLDARTNTTLGLPPDAENGNIETFANNQTVLVEAYTVQGTARLLACPISGDPCRRLSDLGRHPGSWVFGGIPW